MENFVPTDKQKEEFGILNKQFNDKMNAKPGVMEKYIAAMTDEKLRNEICEEGLQDIKDCDKNKDGRLDLEEYMTYLKLVNKKNKERFGDWADYTDDEIKEMYRINNSLSEEEGISDDDFKKAMFVIRLVRQ